MSEIEIKIVGEDEHRVWDDIVQRSPQATANHTFDWLKLVEQHTGSKLFLFAGYLGNQIIAAIPFFWKEQYFLKSFSSPVGSAMIQNLGPIFPGYDSIKQDKREYYFREFQKKLDIYITDHFNPDSIKIITAPNLLDARPYIWNDYSVAPKYNFIKNIEDLDEVWSGFKYRLRRNIEGAKKAGVSIEEGSLEDYKVILKLLSRRLSEQELDWPASDDYFLDIYHKFNNEHIRIFIAKYHGEPVTGIVVLTMKDRLTFWFGAIQTDLKGIYPVDLLLWHVIEWGNKNGYRYCQNLGANIPAVSYFKSRYNFDLEIYFEVTKAKRLYRILSGLRSRIKEGVH